MLGVGQHHEKNLHGRDAIPSAVRLPADSARLSLFSVLECPVGAEKTARILKVFYRARPPGSQVGRRGMARGGAARRGGGQLVFDTPLPHRYDEVAMETL